MALSDMFEFLDSRARPLTKDDLAHIQPARSDLTHIVSGSGTVKHVVGKPSNNIMCRG